MTDEEPLIEPKLVEKLKKRNRLVDFGLRKEILSETQDVIADRRKPSNVAKKAARDVSGQVKQVTEPVMERRLEERLKNSFKK